MVDDEFTNLPIRPLWVRLRAYPLDVAGVDSGTVPFWRLRGSEAEVANGRSRITDVGEVVVAASFLMFHQSLRRSFNWREFYFPPLSIIK